MVMAWHRYICNYYIDLCRAVLGHITAVIMYFENKCSYNETTFMYVKANVPLLMKSQRLFQEMA